MLRREDKSLLFASRREVQGLRARISAGPEFSPVQLSMQLIINTGDSQQGCPVSTDQVF